MNLERNKMSERVDVVAEGRKAIDVILDNNYQTDETVTENANAVDALINEVERLRDLVLDLKSDIEWRINKERD